MPKNARNVAQSFSELEPAIISACDTHESLHKHEQDYKRCIISENFFVKFDSRSSLFPQYITQDYLFLFTARDSNAPRVPQFYYFFTNQTTRIAYLVMEYIATLAPPSVQGVARALEWLRSVPKPPETTIGRLGGGCARHVLFKNNEAPLSFSSVVALEKYLNTVRLYSFIFC